MTTPIKITNLKRFEKNTLKAFFAIELTGLGIVIKDCTLHEKNGKRWISFPAKPFKKQDGSDSWVNIVDFVDNQTKWLFQDEALPLVLAAYGTGESRQPSDPYQQHDNDLRRRGALPFDDEIPFMRP